MTSPPSRTFDSVPKLGRRVASVFVTISLPRACEDSGRVQHTVQQPLGQYNSTRVIHNVTTAIRALQFHSCYTQCYNSHSGIKLICYNQSCASRHVDSTRSNTVIAKWADFCTFICAPIASETNRSSFTAVNYYITIIPTGISREPASIDSARALALFAKRAYISDSHSQQGLF